MENWPIFLIIAYIVFSFFEDTSRSKYPKQCPEAGAFSTCLFGVILMTIMAVIFINVK